MNILIRCLGAGLLAAVSSIASAQSYPAKPIRIITGADGMIGMDACARSPGDGYTLCGVSVAWMSVVPNLRKVPFDPLADVVPITPLVHSNGLLYVNPKVPVSNVSELVALAKAKPGSLTYASFGNGSLARRRTAGECRQDQADRGDSKHAVTAPAEGSHFKGTGLRTGPGHVVWRGRAQRHSSRDRADACQ